VHAAEASLHFHDGATELQVVAPAGYRLVSDHSYDALGRLTSQVDHNKDGAVAYHRTLHYNGQGRVYHEVTVTRQGADTWRSYADHHYGEGVNYALGAVTSTVTNDYRLSNGYDQWQFSTTTSTAYAWRDGAVQSHVSFAKSYQPTYNSYYNYDGSGNLASVTINDGRPRTVTFTNDMNGQAIRRDEQDNNYNAGDPHEIWYRFAGKQMGYTGNNGTNGLDYAESVENRTRTPGQGAFRFGLYGGPAHTDFQQSVDTITSYGGAGGGSYTARAGDTLASVAAQLWGDASLWYKLAEANAISGMNGLAEGQRLTIPAGVSKNTHNAGTFIGTRKRFGPTRDS